MKNGTQGFTLIELLIVIAIIGILAAVLIPNLLGARAKANDSATQSYVRNCYTAVEISRQSDGKLPTTTTTCADSDPAKLGANAVTTPGTVTGAGSVSFDTTGSKYAIIATSVTGKKFCFDGAKMGEATASATGACTFGTATTN